MKKTLLVAVPSFLVGISVGFADPTIDSIDTAFSGAAFQVASNPMEEEVDPSVAEEQPFDSKDPDSIIRNEESLGEGMDSGSASEVDTDVEGFDSQDHVGLEDEPRTEELGAEEN